MLRKKTILALIILCSLHLYGYAVSDYKYALFPKGTYLSESKKVVYTGLQIRYPPKGDFGDTRGFFLTLDLETKEYKKYIFNDIIDVSASLVSTGGMTYTTAEDTLFFAADRIDEGFLVKYKLSQDEVQLIEITNRSLGISQPKILSDRYLFFVDTTRPREINWRYWNYDKGILYVYDLKSGELTRIGSDASVSFEVSPKRQAVFYLKWSSLDWISTKTLVMYEHPGNYKMLSEIQTGPEPGLYLSPDETLLLVASNHPENQFEQVAMIHNLATGEQREIKIDHLVTVDWCQHNCLIGRIQKENEKKTDIFKFNLEDEEIHIICKGADPICVDDKRILYHRRREDPYFAHVFVIRDIETGDEYEFNVNFAERGGEKGSGYKIEW